MKERLLWNLNKSLLLKYKKAFFINPDLFTENMGDGKKLIGWSIVLGLSLIPALYLMFFLNTFPGFSSIQAAMTSLGKMLGLFGMILFSITFLMNTRIKPIENIFGGLDKELKHHHIMGTIAFVTIMIHPMALLASYIAMSFSKTFVFLFSYGALAVWIGIIGLFMMELFLLFTFLINLKYEKWKFVHRLLGVAFIFASIHVLLITSDTKTSLFLRIYMIIFILVGLASFVYRTIFWRKLVKQHDYIITEIKKLDNSITELTLSPKNEKEHISFIPGQFAFLSIESKLTSIEQHPFTISSSPSEKVLRFSIKNLGDYTSEISKLKKGTKVKIEGPYGRFCFAQAKYKSQIWIAGGIGITPFLSQARSMKYEEHYDDVAAVDFYYSVKEESEAIFQKELEGIEMHNNFKVIPFISSKQGYLTAEVIAKQSKTKSRDIFICGPPPMMFSLKKQFIKMGIPKSRIHLEEFAL